MKNQQLLEMLGKRDLTITEVSKLIHSGRAQLTQVLHGQRNGTPTWNKLRKVIDEKELVCAMDFANRSLAVRGLKLELDEKRRVVIRQVPGPDGAPVEQPKNPFFESRKKFHVEQLEGAPA